MKKVHEIRAYDYKSDKEFKSHKAKMENLGWELIRDGMFSGALDPQKWTNEEYEEHGVKWTVHYLKY